MNIQSNKYLRLSALTLATLSISGLTLAGGEVTDALTEARLETQIWTTYALSPHLRALDLSVKVDDGKATLTGKADEDVKKELAEQIALGVKGINDVDNQITVQANYVATKSGSDRRYSEVIDDAAITASVKSKLLWSQYAEGLSTEVNTQSGKVSLTGTASSKNAKEHAGVLAKNTEGVTSVDNKLKIDESKRSATSKAKDAKHDASDTMSDTWITTKVKSSLLYSSNVSGSSIKVITKDGVVTLSGNVNSGSERALAIEISQNVNGVKSVESANLTHKTVKITSN